MQPLTRTCGLYTPPCTQVVTYHGRCEQVVVEAPEVKFKVDEGMQQRWGRIEGWVHDLQPQLHPYNAARSLLSPMHLPHHSWLGKPSSTRPVGPPIPQSPTADAAMLAAACSNPRVPQSPTVDAAMLAAACSNPRVPRSPTADAAVLDVRRRYPRAQPWLQPPNPPIPNC